MLKNQPVSQTEKCDFYHKFWLGHGHGQSFSRRYGLTSFATCLKQSLASLSQSHNEYTIAPLHVADNIFLNASSPYTTMYGLPIWNCWHPAGVTIRTVSTATYTYVTYQITSFPHHSLCGICWYLGYRQAMGMLLGTSSAWKLLTQDKVVGPKTIYHVNHLKHWCKGWKVCQECSLSSL